MYVWYVDGKGRRGRGRRKESREEEPLSDSVALHSRGRVECSNTHILGSRGMLEALCGLGAEPGRHEVWTRGTCTTRRFPARRASESL